MQGKSLRERFFGSGGAHGRQSTYVTKQQHFATAPLPPVPPYAVSDGNNVTFRDIYEHRSGHDGLYGGAMPYVTAGAPMEPPDDIIENVETNIHRNITKNYYINEEQNYFIQNDPSVQSTNTLHDQEVQRLPGPTVTTINMAAERIADNPSEIYFH